MFNTETGTLIDRMLRGESELLPVVLDRMWGRLVLWSQARLSKNLRALLEPEDAAQDIYTRVLMAFPRFDGKERAAFYAWLFTIGRNTLADLGKHHGAKKRQPRELREGTLTSPSQHAARKESLAQMSAALDELDEGDRLALTLRYLEELDYAGVAGVLECSVGAARVRVCRSLGRLKAALESRSSDRDAEYSDANAPDADAPAADAAP